MGFLYSSAEEILMQSVIAKRPVQETKKCVCVCVFFKKWVLTYEHNRTCCLFGRACDGVLGGKQVALTSVPNMRSGKSK